MDTDNKRTMTGEEFDAAVDELERGLRSGRSPSLVLPPELVFVDCETTSLEPEGALIQLGAYRPFGGECFERIVLFRPGARIEPEAMAVNGLAEALEPGTELQRFRIAEEFRSWVKAIDQNVRELRGACREDGAQLIWGGKHPDFDRGFVERDLWPQAGQWFGRRPLDVNSLVNACRIDVSPGVNDASARFRWKERDLMGGMEEPCPHGALRGAKWAFLLWWSALLWLGRGSPPQPCWRDLLGELKEKKVSHGGTETRREERKGDGEPWRLEWKNVGDMEGNDLWAARSCLPNEAAGPLHYMLRQELLNNRLCWREVSDGELSPARGFWATLDEAQAALERRNRALWEDHSEKEGGAS